MNIDKLCEFLQSIKGKGHITEKISANANIELIKIGMGSVLFNYSTENSYTQAGIMCEDAKNEPAPIIRENEKGEPKILSQKNVKKLFRK